MTYGKKAACLLLACLLFLGTVGCGRAPASPPEGAPPSDAVRFAEARVSYLGPEGTYTQEAAGFFFQSAAAFLPAATVDDAIAHALEGRADYAVIPQENTIGGVVTNYVDALIGQDGLYVVGEVILPIRQTLMGVPGAKLTDIQTVCSHAQGLRQSEAWRAEHLPDAAAEEMSSTAAAASFVAQRKDKTIAAVAAPAAAELYGLEVLAENVQLTDANKTRFYVLGPSPLESAGRTQAVLVADCRADRLDDVLVALHGAELELVTLHDRPEGSALGRYRYIIEVADERGITEKQLEVIGGVDELRLLGCFDPVEKAA